MSLKMKFEIQYCWNNLKLWKQLEMCIYIYHKFQIIFFIKRLWYLLVNIATYSNLITE